VSVALGVLNVVMNRVEVRNALVELPPNVLAKTFDELLVFFFRRFIFITRSALLTFDSFFGLSPLSSEYSKTFPPIFWSPPNFKHLSTIACSLSPSWGAYGIWLIKSVRVVESISSSRCAERSEAHF